MTIMKYLNLMSGVLAAGILTGCTLEAPELPAEEIYLRNFIKQHGLIDPNQDFNQAVLSDVKVNIPGHADLINVTALVGDDHYRVASYADVEGELVIPMDVPEFTKEIAVNVDGVVYYTHPGGTVNVMSGAPEARSRATSTEYDDMWITSWGSLQSINFTFNSDNVLSTGRFDVKTTGYAGESGNPYTGGIQVGTNNTSAILDGKYFEIGNTFVGDNVHFKINVPGTVAGNAIEPSSYKILFRTASNNDAKIRVVLLGKDDAGKTRAYLDRELDIEDNSKGGIAGTYNTADEVLATMWEIRTALLPPGEYQFVIIGTQATRDPDGHRYCGNWGFFEMEQVRTIHDMAWILAAEDLGTTDDFDFNDIIIRIETVKVNNASLRIGIDQWQVITDNDEKFTLHAPARVSRDDADKTHIRVTALAAGGTLPLWLHYKDGTGSSAPDYVICPTNYNKDDLTSCLVAASTISDNDESNEWHRWFGVSSHTPMLNTGYNGHKEGASVEFAVDNFTMEKYSHMDYDIGSEAWADKVIAWKWHVEPGSTEYTSGFYITVGSPSFERAVNRLTAGAPGLPPQMFLIPDCSPTKEAGYDEREWGWEWPTERTNILDLYPLFNDWVSNSGESSAHWFLAPKPGIINDDCLRYSRDPQNRTQFPDPQYKDED